MCIYTKCRSTKPKFKFVAKQKLDTQRDDVETLTTLGFDEEIVTFPVAEVAVMVILPLPPGVRCWVPEIVTEPAETFVKGKIIMHAKIAIKIFLFI